MSGLRRLLKETWAWWAPPLLLFGVVALVVVAWLLGVRESPIFYDTL